MSPLHQIMSRPELRSPTPLLLLLPLLLPAYPSVTANDSLPAPEDLQISVPVIGKVLLTWKEMEAPPNWTIDYYVELWNQTARIDRVFVNNNSKEFGYVATSQGLVAKVAATVGIVVNGNFMNFTTATLPPAPRGEEGTAAERLECRMPITAQQEAFLSCDWLPGWKAPPDTRYYLYYRYSISQEEVVGWCRMTEGTSCTIQLRVVDLDPPDEIFIHINGSSGSKKIQIVERIIKTNSIEMHPQIENLTLNTGPNPGLSWSPQLPFQSATCFSYEVNYWSKYKNNTRSSDRPSFWSEDLMDGRSKTHVRVRSIGTCNSSKKVYSPWSEVKDIGGDNEDLLWIVLSVCLFVAAVALFIFCIRFRRSLFPQIPKPRDDLKDAFKFTQHQALMRCNSWDVEEVISYVEVVKSPDKPGRLPPRYPRLSD